MMDWKRCRYARDGALRLSAISTLFRSQNCTRFEPTPLRRMEAIWYPKIVWAAFVGVKGMAD